MPSAAGGAKKPGQPCLEAYTPGSPAPISQACTSPEASLQSSGKSRIQHLLPNGLLVCCMPTHDQRSLRGSIGHMDTLLQCPGKQSRRAMVWLLAR